MNLALTVLQTIAPVFILAGIGFVWVKAGFEYRVAFVTRLSMTLAIPCLIFVALMQTKVDPAALTTVSLAALLSYGALAIVFWGGLRLARLDQRTYLAPLIFGNTGNVGLPIALFAFGDSGLGIAVVVFAVMAVLHFTFGLWLVAGGLSLRRALAEPMVGATLFGALFLWQGWQTPQWLTSSLQLAGQMGIPLMLITLGVAIARLHPRRFALPLLLSVLRLLVCTAIAWGLGHTLGLRGTALGVLVLQVAMPVAVTSYMLAEKYGADSDAAAGLVVLSTLLAVVSIPLTLSFFV